MNTLSSLLSPVVVWFIIGLALLLLEFTTPGLIIFFFGVGAWIVSFTCFFFDISLNTQLALFFISSVALLLLLRKWLKRVFGGFTILKQSDAENLDDFLGQKAVVVREIRPSMPGRVEFHGTGWAAEASETIPEGKPVEIIGKNNLTLMVRQLKGGNE